MKKFICKFVLFVFVMCFGIGGVNNRVYADDLGEVKVWTQKLVDEAIVNIFNRNLTPAERIVPFRNVVMNNFDFDYIAKFVLGVYVRGVGNEKIKKFADAFAELNVVSYVKKFEAYTDSEIEIIDVKPGKKSKQFFVATKVRSGDAGAKDYSVDWRIMQVGKTYKVIDVVVEGVSMALSYKNEYAPILKLATEEGKDPIIDLTDKIEAKVISLKL